MTNADPPIQLRMIWSQRRLDASPKVPLPAGYALRTYCPGDEVHFFQIMARVGWAGWDDKRLQPWLLRILPHGWFLVVHEATGAIVASAMALQDEREFGAQGGELGWVACDPEHQGQGLGAAVSAAATKRMLEEGYRYIHLYTEEWRLAALKTYLRLGYVPLLCAPEMSERWRAVCAAVHWPFTPEVWEADFESLQSS